MGHLPRIDHDPALIPTALALRGHGESQRRRESPQSARREKIEFDPAEAVRYHERTVAERMNARLKDEFGGNHRFGLMGARSFARGSHDKN